MDRSSCGGFLWSTGEDLRNSPDAALAHRLSQTGALHVHGLQGEGLWQDRPRNAPPLESYFISYVDESADDAARGRSATSRSNARAPRRLDAGVLEPPAPAAVLPIVSGPPGLPPAPPGAPPAKPPVRRRQPRQDSRPARRLRPSLPARSGAPRQHWRLRAELPETQHSDRRQMLRRRRARSRRRLLEFKLPGGRDGDRTEQFLLQQQSSLFRRRRRAGMLHRPARQWPMSANEVELSAGIVDRRLPCLRRRLCAGRRLLLPRKQGDLDRRLLPRRRGAGARPKDVRADLPRSGRPALLRLQPHSDRERRVLLAGERDDELANAAPAGRFRRPVRVPASTEVIKPCAAGYTSMADGTCCNNRNVSADGRECIVGSRRARAGETHDRQGACVPIRVAPIPPPAINAPACPPGAALTREGACAPIPARSLPAGRDAYQWRQVRRAAGLPSWRDANPRRQVPAELRRRPARPAKREIARASASRPPRQPVRLARRETTRASAWRTRRRNVRPARCEIARASASRLRPPPVRPARCEPEAASAR